MIKTFYQRQVTQEFWTILVLVLAQSWWTFLIHFKCWRLL